MNAIRDHRHLFLLLALLLMALLQPVAHGFLEGLVFYDIFLSLVLIGVVAIVFDGKTERIVSLLLAVPTILARGSAYFLAGHDQIVATVIHHGLALVFFSFALAVIVRDIFEVRELRTDHFIGTVCGYLLAGAAWGNGYMLADLLSTGAFSVKSDIVWQLQDDRTRSFLFNYFSFCTLTGAGFGDITPIGPVVAALTWLEAMFGQFYIAMVVAQLVGIKLAQSMNKP